SALEGKHVVFRRNDRVRLRREGFDPIGKVHTLLDEVRNGLFGILRALRGCEQLFEVGEVASGGRGLESIVESGEVCGHRTAAGTAEGADTCTVDVFAADEVVDAAHRIVDHVTRDVIADQ